MASITQTKSSEPVKQSEKVTRIQQVKFATMQAQFRQRKVSNSLQATKKRPSLPFQPEKAPQPRLQVKKVKKEHDNFEAKFLESQAKNIKRMVSLKVMEELRGVSQKLRAHCTKQHFIDICGEEEKGNYKLRKPRFKQYLSKRYGPQVAEKWANVFDFTNPLDFKQYSSRIVD